MVSTSDLNSVFIPRKWRKTEYRPIFVSIIVMTDKTKNWVNWSDYFPKEEAGNVDFGSSAFVTKLAFLLAKPAFIMNKIPVGLDSPRLQIG